MKNLNPSILLENAQDFIHKNLKSDISALIFRGSPIENLSIQELVEQIEAKNKCEHKLPTWFNTRNIYYPNKLHIEQTSSEITASYKANLIEGASIIDLTGGFGVDAYYFSKKFKKVTYCEIQAPLSNIVKHNFSQFGNTTIEIKNVDGLDYLAPQELKYDWIYLDPSRRSDLKGKVFLLDDCLPRVPENLQLLFNHSDNILIKVSPMLDISSSIKELSNVKEIHVVAIHNEVKELLFILENSYVGDIFIKTANIARKNIQTFNTTFKKQIVPNFTLPLAYLFEPNAAILKAGLFDDITMLGLTKLHKHSHLYTSDVLIDFPGRRFQIQYCIPYDKKQLKELIPSLKANITTRNFPETVAQIRKKTGIKDGGNNYLFFTTLMNQKHAVLICSKI